MSVATWSQFSGTSTFVISKTTEPSGFEMRETRVAKLNDANGDAPGVVKRRGIERRVVMNVLLCVDVLLIV